MPLDFIEPWIPISGGLQLNPQAGRWSACMVRPYSLDLCDRLVAAVEAGDPRRGAFGVRVSVAVKWVQRVMRTGRLALDRSGGFRRTAPEPERDRVLA